MPFASHPINKIKWEVIFKDLFKEIGEKIKKNKIRVSMHHRLNNNGERFSEILKDVIKTWKIKDGPQIVDYSSLKLSGRKGSHAEKINLKDFYSFLKEVLKVTSCIDIMLEIKDKEKSALKAINFIKNKNIQLPN